MFRFFDIFSKKEYYWYYTSTCRIYDISKHPEVSSNSLIKEFKMYKMYRYCPKYCKLQTSNRHKYHDIDLIASLSIPEVLKLVEDSDKIYIRDSKIKKLLKK